jgi:hypothetical protein
MINARLAHGGSDAWVRLVAEGRLLARWRAAGVAAPRVVREAVERRVQVRERMHGLTGEVIEDRLFGSERPDAQGRGGD